MKKALLIGINDYPCGNELHGCVEDVKSLHSVLERNEMGQKILILKIYWMFKLLEKRCMLLKNSLGG